MKNFKIPAFIKNFPPLQIFLFVIFVIYIIFPIPTPQFMAFYIDSSLGMIFIFCVTLFLFLYANPILAITYVFVGYEVLRRSSISAGNTVLISNTEDSNIIKYPNTLHSVNSTNLNNNNISDATIYAVSLEEEIIQTKKQTTDSFTGEQLIYPFNPLNSTAFMNASFV